MDSWSSLNRAPAHEASTWLLQCCGAARWVKGMLARRPFSSHEALLAAAREEWFALSPAEWQEAFRHHPRLGGRGALETRLAATRALSAREQSALSAAPDAVLYALADDNRRYEEKFDFIFIACASGQTAEALLVALRERLANDPDRELGVAAEEHARITALRLSRPWP